MEFKKRPKIVFICTIQIREVILRVNRLVQIEF